MASPDGLIVRILRIQSESYGIGVRTKLHYHRVLMTLPEGQQLSGPEAIQETSLTTRQTVME
jgi:hypothetical protein